jgi:outer membrane receptor for ferrienterochelin and colicin
MNGFTKTILLGATAMGAFAAAFTTPAFAQGAPGATGSGDKVVVTGSRIRRPSDATAKAPLTVIGAKQIEQTRTVTLEQILSKLPEFGSQGANDQNSIAPGGASFTDLRNLGPKRTLVLVNGKRMTSTFVLGAQGVDLNNIPASMIDRVEVLRDGASPIYGADAIGGVVNVILRKNSEWFGNRRRRRYGR